MKKKVKFLFKLSVFSICTFYIWLIVNSISPHLPHPGKKALLYSNQCRQDLKITTVSALKKAKKSIHLVTFGLSDPSVLKILHKKSKENLNLKVFYDRRSSPYLDLEKHQAVAVKTKGLMHQKIIVIDEKYVFLGSANMTSSSLSMHDNLIIGLFSPEIATFLTQKAPYSPGFLSCMVGGQQVELWLLPDTQSKALNRITELLAHAKKKIQITMFTFTHPKLIDELIKAKERGVKVKVVVDYKSSRGASKKAIERLRKENVAVLTSNGPQLCHHKYIYIDDKTLICGSANWTLSAFKKNYDCFMVLFNLSHSQKSFMKKLDKVVKLESTLIK